MEYKGENALRNICENGMHVQNHITGRCLSCQALCDASGWLLNTPENIKYRNRTLEVQDAPLPDYADKKSIRETILDEAKKAVLHDRNKDYGNPENNFADICALWNTRLAIRLRNLGLALVPLGSGQVSLPIEILKSWDVPIFMSDVKDCRIEQSPKKLDHWIDKAGYSACGGDCAINSK